MKLGRQEIEWMVPLLTLLLIACGMTVLYSASIAAGGGFFVRQAIYVGVGVLIGTAIALIPERMVLATSYLFYIFILLLLGLVLVVGTGPTGRWLGVGAFHIQPSELAKLGVILALARFLSDRRTDLSKLRYILGMALLGIVPFGLILIEPDLGTSLVIPVITGVMAYLAGIPLLIVLFVVSPVAVMVASINPYALVVVIGVLLALGYFAGIRINVAVVWGAVLGGIGWMTPKLWVQLQPYQRNRLVTFVNPEADPLGAGYQIIQSKVAIGSGKFWGKGFMEGTQTHRGFLPEQHTDFIFSVLGEEFGFFGAIVVLVLFWLLIVRLFYLTKKVTSPFGKLVIGGVGAVVVFQVIVNVGMTTGVMPVTGLPLPLISYGGSSLLTMLLLLGLATGMASRWRASG